MIPSSSTSSSISISATAQNNNDAHLHSSKSTQPFQALFRSACSLQPPLSQSNSITTQFSSPVILLQYSFALHKRILAATPASTTDPTVIVGSQDISKKDIMGGPSLLHLALEECIQNTNVNTDTTTTSNPHVGNTTAGVILVQTVATTSSTESLKNSKSGCIFIVDLTSNAYGWDDDDDKNSTSDTRKTTLKCRIDKLASIFQTIEQALHIISSSRSSTSVSTENNGTKNTTVTVPILFDSIAPLVLHHGMSKVLLFLQQLKTNLCARDDTYNNDNNYNKRAVGSPIVIPTPLETMTPYDNRLLEDMSDSVICLQNGSMDIARRSLRTPSSPKVSTSNYGTTNPAAQIISGGMYSSSVSCGGKRLIREIQHFEIQADTTTKDRIDRNHNIFGGKKSSVIRLCNSSQPVLDNNDNDKGSKDGVNVSKEMGTIERGDKLTERKGIVHSSSGKGSSGKSIQLQHEDEESREKTTSSSLAPAVNTPRIYMEENDPEFDDLDEEDPDDDLDL